MVDPNDAKGITIPLALLASQDEDADAVKAFEKELPGEGYFDRFDDQVHGFMAARGDLKDEKVRSEYERGYKALLDFLYVLPA